MMTFGWDLGGAHVKLAVLDGKGDLARAEQVPCRLWLGLGELEQALRALGGADVPNERHAVTMTGELVDLFPDRATGVQAIVETFLKITGARDVVILAGDTFVEPDLARTHWHTVASANWRATLQMTARLVDEALVVDIGSTTTDLMLVTSGKPVDGVEDDHGRLAAETLVYTGVVRTPLMAFAQRAPFGGRWVGLMAEYFATSGDLYRISGELDPAFDHSDTADGRGRSKAESVVRLVRMIGLDPSSAPAAAWEQLAGWFARLQLDRLRDACQRQFSRGAVGPAAPLVGLGVGAFVVQKLAATFARPYLDFATLAKVPPELAPAAAVCGPALAVARLAFDRNR